MISRIATLRACSDCVMYIAYDDQPDDRGQRPEGHDIGQDILDYLAPRENEFLVLGDSEDAIEFSWSPCECCGTLLGGARHDVHLMCESADAPVGWRTIET